jgi:hypothetical protein
MAVVSGMASTRPIDPTSVRGDLLPDAPLEQLVVGRRGREVLEDRVGPDGRLVRADARGRPDLRVLTRALPGRDVP